MRKHDWQEVYKRAKFPGEAFRDITEADQKWIVEETSKYKFDDNDSLKMGYLTLLNPEKDTDILNEFE